MTLVIGGASSGKSAFAERYVAQAGLKKTYIATAEALDDEMREKISRHRRDRAGHGWDTVEAPRDLSGALRALDPDDIALVDCVTFWLSNHMMDEADWSRELAALCDTLPRLTAPVVLVTNEVGSGGVVATSLGRQFQKAQGLTNQRLAATADLVVQVTAGLPLVLKGADLAEDAPWV
ncbi:MAG: bifunctional adenosylcobinamide kinase/adenosylcobinamide-phosphate guanylyltransferase [Pseudomonadota bacterium]